MGALALSFGACSSEDEMAPVNPTYDPVANTVNANFAFNVAGQSSKTRMTAATTQANDEQSFRGMQDAKLIALTQDNDGRVLTAAQADGKVFNLGNILYTQICAVCLRVDNHILKLLHSFKATAVAQDIFKLRIAALAQLAWCRFYVLRCQHA